MLASSIPYKFLEVFANAAASGYVTSPIPQTTTGANVSQHLGFPPITSYNPAAGGLAPTIEDFNGIFAYMSAWINWAQAGGVIPYDATFQTAIGGYPNACVVGSATVPDKFWRSTVDNNTTNPDTGGAGWIAQYYTAKAMAAFATPGTFIWTCPAGVIRAKMRVWGGGGGGGGAGAAISSGGAAGGGYAEGNFDVVPGTGYVVIVGTGGGGGAGTPTVGGDGQTSSVAAFLSATGGAGGQLTLGQNGVGGGAGGALNLSGYPGIGGSGTTAGAGGSGGLGTGCTPVTTGVSLGGTFPGGGGPGATIQTRAVQVRAAS